MKIQELVDLGDGATGELVGKVTHLSHVYTKRGGLMARFVLAEDVDEISASLFPSGMQTYGHLLEYGKTITVQALLDGRADVPVVMIKSIDAK